MMDAQQLHDYIINPTLKRMGRNYNSKNARMLLLATAAIESKCGCFIKQVGGIALGVWQMEPDTHADIWMNCDALNVNSLYEINECIGEFQLLGGNAGGFTNMLDSPKYSCAMARLKYSMDIEPLPDYNDISAIYKYYKRIYNTEAGASTFQKFFEAWNYCGLDRVDL